MSYYDHATLMTLKLDRWSEKRFLPPRVQQKRMADDFPPGAVCAPFRRTTWLDRLRRYLGRQRHVRT